MKQVYLILALSFVYVGLHAQNMSLAKSDSLHADSCVNDEWAVIEAVNYINNNTGNQLSVTWTVLNKTAPAEWLLSFCDNNACYPLDNNNTGTYTIDPSDQGLAKAWFRPGTTAGYGEFSILEYSGSDSLVLRFSADGSICIGIDEFKEDLNVSVYPNPVRSTLNLTITGAAEAQKIEIYNIIGSKMLEKDLDNRGLVIKDQVDVESFKKGVYFVKVLDKHGQVLHSSTFNKTQ